MLGKTHRPFALAAAAGTLLLVHSHLPVYDKAQPLAYAASVSATLGAAYVTSMLPDIDKAFPWHRGITHAVWAPMALLWLAFYKFAGHGLYMPLFFGAAVGYLSHLFGDAFSKAGIAWFYPFQRYIRYANGSFVVKGFRGPFQPLYEVGDTAFCFMPYVWRAVFFILAALLVKGVTPWW